jgi:hypothetical protein
MNTWNVNYCLSLYVSLLLLCTYASQLKENCYSGKDEKIKIYGEQYFTSVVCFQTWQSSVFYHIAYLGGLPSKVVLWFEIAWSGWRSRPNITGGFTFITKYARLLVSQYCSQVPAINCHLTGEAQVNLITCTTVVTITINTKDNYFILLLFQLHVHILSRG